MLAFAENKISQYNAVNRFEVDAQVHVKNRNPLHEPHRTGKRIYRAD